MSGTPIHRRKTQAASGRQTARQTAAGLLVHLVALAGCANNPVVLQQKLQTAQAAQQTLASQNQELTGRVNTLDEDNQELSTLLAQAQQQNRVLADQMAAVREQLGDTTAQLNTAREDFARTSQQANLLAASVNRRASARITANSSGRARLEAIEIPGVEVRSDGDVIRIELPGERLFATGSAQLQSGGPELIETVARQIAATYPDQMIGIEGHTDSDPVQGGPWRTNHQLSIGRAMAVYDHLVARSALRPPQLFVVGHGANHPVVSNATAAGKQRNRRVELVIYPETISG